MRIVPALLVTTLAAVLLAPAAIPPSAQAAELAGRYAVMTTADRAPGAPAPGSTPDTRLLDAEVHIDLLDETLYVEAHLESAPAPGEWVYNNPYFLVVPGT